jgi:glycosyltransferase involved in cell wall biosynthesis
MITLYLVTHNYTRFLDDALESIKKQTLAPSQIILIDNGSTDGVQEKFYPWHGKENVTVIYNSNIGHINAANQALALAKGEYIIRLDGDDILLPDALQNLFMLLEQNLEAAYAFGDYYLCDEQGVITALVDSATRSIKKVQTDSSNLAKKIIADTTNAQLKTSDFDYVANRNTTIKPHGACTLIRTRLLKKAGGYTGTFGINDGEELAIKLTHYKYIHIDKPIFLYRQHRNNLSLY